MKNILLLICCCFCIKIQAQSTTINGPVGSKKFGWGVFSLPNGNYIITDPFFDDGALTNVGAVFLYNGQTKQLISTLKGEKAGDVISFDGIEILSNGNFVVKSSGWQNGTLQSCGAITWVNASTGLNAVVNQTNSLVGTKADDNIGLNGIFALPNGNYVVCSKNCDNGSAINAGAVTWGSGTIGVKGFVTTSNSILGSSTGDLVGDESGQQGRSKSIHILSNGNFVIRSLEWDNAGLTDVGAVTWVNGATGLTGVLSSSNSIIGSSANDQVGRDGVTTLSNGNYAVVSAVWDNAALVNAGAATWCNGTTGLSGLISASNSLVGDRFSMLLGAQGVFALTNGNYVVCTSSWYDLSAIGKGAVTFCNGNSGRIGVITTSNSLTGGSQDDRIGLNGIAVLPNGNYVVKSNRWFNFRGAITWCNGTNGQTTDNSLSVSASNSLVGTAANEGVGIVDVLPNGNYVARTAGFSTGAINGVGAVTLCNGTSGNTIGQISSNNSILGQKLSDAVGSQEITALTNGSFVIPNSFWDNGAVVNVGAITFCKGVFTSGQPSPTSGLVNSSNSLIGSTADDKLGLDVGGLASPFRKPITALSNGNYVVRSPFWSNVAVANVGAVTLGNGTTGVSGFINLSNSLIGSLPQDFVGNDGIIPLENGNYVVNSQGWDNGAISNAGAVTFCSGNIPTVGVVSSTNSLIANVTYNSAKHDLQSIPNTMYMVKGIDSQANNFKSGVAIVSAATGLKGFLDNCNSVLTNSNNIPSNSYNAVNNFLIVGILSENKAVLFNPQNQVLSPINTSNTNVIAGQGTVTFVDTNCKLISSLLANGANPISGSTTAKVWLETTQPANFVKRHFEITPTTNATTATGKVSLYFTQQEFNDFNIVSAIDLPTSPSDNTGIANVLIEKFSGTSSNNSGLPTTYTGSFSTINPADADVVWNASESRWEISFDVTGFSGFFLKTQSTSLPINEFESKNIISVYPNPVIDELNISLSNQTIESALAEIIDLNGRILKRISINNETSSIDTSNLSKGIYIVRFTNSGKISNQKIIKN